MYMAVCGGISYYFPPTPRPVSPPRAIMMMDRHATAPNDPSAAAVAAAARARAAPFHLAENYEIELGAWRSRARPGLKPSAQCNAQPSTNQRSFPLIVFVYGPRKVKEFKKTEPTPFPSRLPSSLR